MSCQKIPYESKSLALADIKHIAINRIYRSKMHGKSQKAGRKMRPYECKRCGKWHLTTSKAYRHKSGVKN